MQSVKRVGVIGGGIGGLTVAHALTRSGFKVELFERSPIWRENYGGGIGLWRNSLNCFSSLGLQKELIQYGSHVKEAMYYTHTGQILAKPTPNFNKTFPLLGIDRRHLQATMVKHLPPSTIQLGWQFSHYKKDKDKVILYFTNGEQVEVDLLVGADGIHSVIRDQIYQEKGMPLVKPYYCGYAYFRANLDIEKDYDFSAWEAWGNDGKRFSYVPIKQPTSFWFSAMKMEPDLKNPFSHPVNEEEYSFIKEQYKNWFQPIPHLIQITPPHTIIRTDIYRLPTLKVWHSDSVVLLGDACHATAPNLAQGAGLAIEDALQLASLLSAHQPTIHQIPKVLDQYQQIRTKRAWTVQTIADVIALVGQIENKALATLRNGFLQVVPSFIAQVAFEKVVRYSLGWNYSVPELQDDKGLLFRLLGQEEFEKLDLVVQRYRSSKSGSGTGNCDVIHGSSLFAKLILMIIRAPKASKNATFRGVTERNHSKEVWTRYFNEKPYSTTMSISNNQLIESPGFGISLGMWVNIDDRGIVNYKSDKCWFLGIPIPSLLSPKSSWIEEPTNEGWKFHGTISHPFCGTILEYKGNFTVQQHHQ